MSNREFVAYFFFVKWTALALGVSLHLSGPHLEIHLPFGFVRIGWVRKIRLASTVYFDQGSVERTRKRTFGVREGYLDD